MIGLFVLSRENQSMKELEEFEGGDIVILVVVDPRTVASSFDDTLRALEWRANTAADRLIANGKGVRVVVEWGDKTETVANALIRERAQLLNKS